MLMDTLQLNRKRVLITQSLSDIGPLFSSVAPSSDNTTLTVTLMRRHIMFAIGSGDLDKDDFSLTITGGTATFSGGLSTATPTA